MGRRDERNAIAQGRAQDAAEKRAYFRDQSWWSTFWHWIKSLFG
jgi:hypothetical protein